MIDDKEEFWIADHERETLVEVLSGVHLLLSEEKVWFNEKGLEYNQPYITFIESMIKRFSNMPVEKEK